MVERVIVHLRDTHFHALAKPYAEKLSVTGMKFREVDALNIFGALQYMFRGAVRYETSTKELYETILATTDMNKSAAKIVCASWQQEYVESKDRDTIEPTVGTLRRLDWRLGVSMSSSESKELQSPFVTLSMDVTDSSGETKHRIVELSTTEFYRLRDSLTTAMNRLEMV